MLFDVHWINVNPYLERKEQPVFMLQRPLLHGDTKSGGVFNIAEVARVGTYYTPTSAINEAEPKFSLTKSGDLVRIPVFAYRTQIRALSSILGVAMQLGISATYRLQQIVRGDEIESVTMILGHECHELPEPDGFRCYAGLSFKMK